MTLYVQNDDGKFIPLEEGPLFASKRENWQRGVQYGYIYDEYRFVLADEVGAQVSVTDLSEIMPLVISGYLVPTRLLRDSNE